MYETDELNENVYVDYSYKLLNFSSSTLQVTPISLENGYSRILTTSTNISNHIYLCHQKANDENILITDYLSVYYDDNLNQVLKYKSYENEVICYMGNSTCITTNGLIKLSKTATAKADFNFNDDGGLILQTPKHIGENFVVKNGAYNKYGLMKLDKTYLINPETNGFSSISKVSDGYAIATNGGLEYYRVNVITGEAFLIEDYFVNKNIEKLISAGLELYVIETDEGYTFCDFKGNPVYEDVAKFSFCTSPTRGVQIELYDKANNLTNFIYFSTTENLNIDKSSSVAEKDGLSSAAASAYTTSISLKYTSGGSEVDAGTATITQEENPIVEIKMKRGLYLENVTFNIHLATDVTITINSTNFADYYVAADGVTICYPVSYTISGGSWDSEIYAYFAEGDATSANNIYYYGVLSYNNLFDYSSVGFDTSVGERILINNNITYAHVYFKVYNSSTYTSDAKYLNTLSSTLQDVPISIVNSTTSVTLPTQSITYASVLNWRYEQDSSGNAIYYNDSSVFDVTDNIYTVWDNDISRFATLGAAGATVSMSAIPQLNLYVYAEYQYISYSITYERDNMATETVPMGYDDVFIPEIPFKTGYEFVSWNITGMDDEEHCFGYDLVELDNKTYSTTDESVSEVTYIYFKFLRGTSGTVVFTANWEPIKYYVEFDTNGGVLDSSSSSNGYFEDYNYISGPVSNNDPLFVFDEEYFVDSPSGNTVQFIFAYVYDLGATESYTYPLIIFKNSNSEDIENITSSHDFVVGGTFEYGGDTYTYIAKLEDFEGDLFDTMSDYYYWYVEEGYNSWTFPDWYRLRLRNTNIVDAAKELVEVYQRKTGYVATYDRWASVPEISKTGYSFVRWEVSGADTSCTHYLNSSASDTGATSFSSQTTTTATQQAYFKNLFSTTNMTNKVTFKAIWDVSSYNITYDYAGGSLASGVTNPSSIYYDEELAVTKPTKLGYTFNGWKVENITKGTTIYTSTFAASYINLTHTSGDTIKFTANWTQNTHSITYVLHSGSFAESQPTSIKYDEWLIIAAPTYTGYTFTGWVVTGLSEDCTHYYGTSSTSNSSTLENAIQNTMATHYKNLRSTSGTVTFTAVWEKNRYSIVYDYSECLPGLNNPDYAEFGSWFYVSTPLTAPTGYHFSGWQISGMSDSAHYYGENIESHTDFYGETFTTPNIRYYTQTYFTNLTTVSGGTVTIKPTWEANGYSIAYNLNGGTQGAEFPSEAVYDTPFKLTNPTRAGYTFVRWDIENMNDGCTHYYSVDGGSETSFVSALGKYSIPNSSPNTYRNLCCIEYQEVLFVAYWSANGYTVTYHYLPGDANTTSMDNTAINKIGNMTGSKTQSVVYDKYFTTYLPSNSGAFGTNEVPVPKGVYLKFWTFSTTELVSTSSSVTWNDDVAEPSKPNSATPNSEIFYNFASTNVHAYAGYEFANITLKYVVPTSESSAINDISAYSVSDNTGSVKFNASFTFDSGSSYAHSSQFLGWMVSQFYYVSGTLSEQSVSKYTHGGTQYTANAGATVLWGFDSNLAHDLEEPVYYLYAVYKQNTYEIQYDLNGGLFTSAQPSLATYGEWFEVDAPTFDGHTFKGWKITGLASDCTHYYGISSSNYSTTQNTSIEETKATHYKDLKNYSGIVTFTAIWE